MKILIGAYLNLLQFCSFVLSLLHFSPVLFTMFQHIFKQLFFIAGRVHHTNSSTLPSAGRGLAHPSVWPPASWRVQQSWSSRHRSCLIWQEESITTSLSGRTEKTGKNLNLRWLANQFPKVVDIREEVTKNTAVCVSDRQAQSYQIGILDPALCFILTPTKLRGNYCVKKWLFVDWKNDHKRK